MKLKRKPGDADSRCFSWLLFYGVFSLFLVCILTVPAPAADPDANNIFYATTQSGEVLRIHFIGWKDADIELAAKVAASLEGLPQTGVLGKPIEVVLTQAAEFPSLGSADKEEIKDLALKGVPVICEGAEADLTALLGLSAVDVTPAEHYELFGIKIQNGTVSRASFLLGAQRGQELLKYDQTAPEVITRGPVPEVKDPVLDPGQIRSSLLLSALQWAFTAGPDTAEMKALTLAPLAMEAAETGSWTSLPDLRKQWSWVTPNCCPWDYNTDANVFTVTADFYKIPDGKSGQDFYLIDVDSHHQANKDVEYVASAGYCDSGWVGWYANERSLRLESYYPSSTSLFEYGPTGTLSQETISISLGASLDTGAAGVNGSYSTSYTNSDATVIDESSLADEYNSWRETFIGARYTAGPCPLCVWYFQHPSQVARASFQSKRVAIYETGDLNNGVTFKLSPTAKFYKDEINWDFCVLVDVFSIGTWSSEVGSPRTVRVAWNYPPDAPGRPSVPTPLWVNDPVNVSVSPASDRDGDNLQYSFDYGDLTVSPWGQSSQVHTWTTPEQVRVRAKAKDIHGAESSWSEYAEVTVKGLEYVTIAGLTLVPEKSSAQMDCSAFFSDGSSRPVTADYPSGWEGGSIQWSANSPYAAISTAGVLTTLDGNGADRLVTVTATYTVHGTTRTDTHLLTLKDTDLDGDCLANEYDRCPYDADCDDDGLTDGSCSPGEDLNNNGVVDPGETDPMKPDTDGDGILDGTERGLTAPQQPQYTDMNVFVPDADPSTMTNPVNPDSDSDGLTDGEEDRNRNGKVDPGETAPGDADADDDGVLDGADKCRFSDLRATVVIGTCDSGVVNLLLPGGCTTNDQIAGCAAAAQNHGGFVSCVAEETNTLKSGGTMTGREKGAVQSCAAGAGIPW